MNRNQQAHRSSQRNAGLRRLRRINRTLAATTVALSPPASPPQVAAPAPAPAPVVSGGS